MAAHIEKRAQHAILGTHDHNVVAGHIENLPVASIGYFFGAADGHPFALENAGFLTFVK